MEGFHETVPMQAVHADSVTISYLFTRDDGYQDGEEYTIPILAQGTELAEGTLGILSDAKTVKVQSGEDEEVMVSITDNQLDIYKESVNYLTGYKYLCNEQLASKLIGLLAYQQYMQSKGEKVKVDKAIRPIIQRLTNHQNKHQKQTCRKDSLFLHIFWHFSLLHRTKNVPWHILAPAAVACDIYLIRRSAHPRGAFFTLQESNFL